MTFFKKKGIRRYWWEPKPDITAFEISQSLRLIVCAITESEYADATFDQLPDEAKRHWRITIE